MRTLIALACLAMATPAFADTAVSPLQRARADSAAKAFALVEARYKSGSADIEAVYRWSVRWYEAQRESQPKPAAQDHLKRMQALETTAKARAASGVAPADEAVAAEYFRAEAALWAAR
jgi:hypothetical protein